MTIAMYAIKSFPWSFRGKKSFGGYLSSCRSEVLVVFLYRLRFDDVALVINDDCDVRYKIFSLVFSWKEIVRRIPELVRDRLSVHFLIRPHFFLLRVIRVTWKSERQQRSD